MSRAPRPVAPVFVPSITASWSGKRGTTLPGCGPEGVPGNLVSGLHADGLGRLCVAGAGRFVQDVGARLEPGRAGDLAAVQSRAVAIASRTALLSNSRWRSGLSSQLDWLDAERTELRSRRLAVQVRSAQCVATVGLVRALGGGWE
jgi:hypothetical protein